MSSGAYAGIYKCIEVTISNESNHELDSMGIRRISRSYDSIFYE